MLARSVKPIGYLNDTTWDQTDEGEMTIRIFLNEFDFWNKHYSEKTQKKYLNLSKKGISCLSGPMMVKTERVSEEQEIS